MTDATTKQGATPEPKRHTRTKTTEDWIREARLLIGNACEDPVIASRLECFGYDAARLTAGMGLHDELSALILRQRAEYGQRYEATEAASAAWAKADEAYLRAIGVARIALRDHRRPRSAMMVDGPRNRSLTGWLAQAEAFYGNLLSDPEAMADMGRFGYTAEALRLEQGLVNDISVKYGKSRREAGEAQGATRERDHKMDELARWVSDFRAIAKLALKDTPEKLKALGI